MRRSRQIPDGCRAVGLAERDGDLIVLYADLPGNLESINLGPIERAGDDVPEGWQATYQTLLDDHRDDLAYAADYRAGAEAAYLAGLGSPGRWR